MGPPLSLHFGVKGIAQAVADEVEAQHRDQQADTCGNPDEQVVLITGDGSFQMNIQELSTCLEFGIKVKIFILDNHTLGMVRQWQRMFYQGRISSTNLNYNPDFVAVAKAYGHNGEVVEKREDLEAAIDRALNYDGLYIVDILCDTDAKVLPMQQARGSMSDMFLGEE